MKVTDQNMDYSFRFNTEKYRETDRNYSEYIEPNAHKVSESNQQDSNNCSVNDLYEVMTRNGITITTIDVYNMSHDMTLYFSDAGKLSCIDMKSGYYLWEISLTKSEEMKLDELAKKNMDFILRDKEMVEEYLKGNISMEDIEKWMAKVKEHTIYDEFFGGCSDAVNQAWEKIGGINVVSGNSIGKDYFLTEMDKYLLMHSSDNDKIKDASTEDILALVRNFVVSLKESLELYSMSIQKQKLKECNVWESFMKELEKIK